MSVAVDAEDEAEVNLREYLEVIRRHWWILVLALLLATGVATGISLATVPVYRASTTVTIDRSPPLLLLEASTEFSLFADQAAAQAPDVLTLIELTKSAVVREGAAARLTPDLGPASAGVFKDLSVQQVRETELVRISVDHPDPKIAAAAANAAAESLIDMNLRDRRLRVSETRGFIEEQLNREGQRLREREDALVAFKERHGDVSLAEETTLSLQKLAELEAQRVDLHLQQREAQTRIAQGRVRLSRQARISPTQWRPSPLIATLQSQLASLEIELSGLREQFTDKHPRVVATQAKIEETKRRLNGELTRSLQTEQFGVDPVYQQLRQQVAQAEVSRAALEAREQALAAAIQQYGETVRAVPAREAELARLTRTAKGSEEIYLLLSGKLQEARIAEVSIGSAIRQVDRAGVPGTPVRPHHLTNLLLGAILGLTLGGVAVVLRDLLDDTVRSDDDVARILDVPVVGSIPLMGNGHVGRDGQRRGAVHPVLADLDHPSAVAEAFRGLRTHVVCTLPDVEPKILLITSPTPQEGTSTVAANLALALARADRRVWLVDADLRRSALGRLFPDAAAAGLTEFLAGRAKVEHIGHRAHDSLWVVASGDAVPNPTELLAGRRLRELVSAARAEADIVLFDSPPVLAVTDAEIVGRQVDGVLLVVKVGQTGRRALAEARQRLEHAGARIVGAVLTFVAPERRSTYTRYFRLDTAVAQHRGRNGHPVGS